MEEVELTRHVRSSRAINSARLVVTSSISFRFFQTIDKRKKLLAKNRKVEFFGEDFIDTIFYKYLFYYLQIMFENVLKNAPLSI